MPMKPDGRTPTATELRQGRPAVLVRASDRPRQQHRRCLSQLLQEECGKAGIRVEHSPDGGLHAVDRIGKGDFDMLGWRWTSTRRLRHLSAPANGLNHVFYSTRTSTAVVAGPCSFACSPPASASTTRPPADPRGPAQPPDRARQAPHREEDPWRQDPDGTAIRFLAWCEWWVDTPAEKSASNP